MEERTTSLQQPQCHADAIKLHVYKQFSMGIGQKSELE